MYYLINYPPSPSIKKQKKERKINPKYNSQQFSIWNTLVSYDYHQIFDFEIILSLILINRYK